MEVPRLDVEGTHPLATLFNIQIIQVGAMTCMRDHDRSCKQNLRYASAASECGRMSKVNCWYTVASPRWLIVLDAPLEACDIMWHIWRSHRAQGILKDLQVGFLPTCRSLGAAGVHGQLLVFLQPSSRAVAVQQLFSFQTTLCQMDAKGQRIQRPWPQRLWEIKPNNSQTE